MTQGSTVEITVVNRLPKDWDSISGGITIHWHGLGMRGFQWYDGTAFGSQCPIPASSSFKYRFKVRRHWMWRWKGGYIYIHLF